MNEVKLFCKSDSCTK